MTTTKAAPKPAKIRYTKHSPCLAWHYINGHRTLGYGDGRLVNPGEVLSTPGIPALCSHGMHGSKKLAQNWSYETHNGFLCRVGIWGRITASSNKFVGQNRKVFHMVKVTDFFAWAFPIILDKLGKSKAALDKELRQHIISKDSSYFSYANSHDNRRKLQARLNKRKTTARTVSLNLKIFDAVDDCYRQLNAIGFNPCRHIKYLLPLTTERAMEKLIEEFAKNNLVEHLV